MEKKRNENEDLELEMEAEDDIEDESLEIEEETSADKLKRLREKLKLAEKDKMSALEELQRARADFLNARRRLDEEKINDRTRMTAGLIEDILPLADSFDMALQDPAFETASENLKKGLQGIYLQLSSILKNYGAEAFGKTGDEFDPNLHEALADNGNGSVVKDVILKGYKMGDKIIRHAKVTVE
ncbi:nucleotide exchange factor GrpE [Candidatus Nomurabacteria bacterium]|nr:nucleotide exchange factor GrpE [Candidatus Nomurabacteria bacterium]